MLKVRVKVEYKKAVGFLWSTHQEMVVPDSQKAFEIFNAWMKSYVIGKEDNIASLDCGVSLFHTMTITGG